MYFEITKRELRNFLTSITNDDMLKWDRLKDKNNTLYNSLNELSQILDTYWLFGKPGDYILNEKWQFSDVMYMSKYNDMNLPSMYGKKFIDLIEMDFFKPYIRNRKLEGIC